MECLGALSIGTLGVVQASKAKSQISNCTYKALYGLEKRRDLAILVFLVTLVVSALYLPFPIPCILILLYFKF